MTEPRKPRSHRIAMTITLIVMLAILALLLGAHPGRAQGLTLTFQHTGRVTR